jgi:hypothetical protein
MSRVDQEIWIKDIYTADGDLDETNAFEWDDPFSIVLELERSVARDSPAYPLEIMVQIVNPRTDPSDVGPWKGEGGKPLYSLDFTREVALDPSSGISLGWKTKLPGAREGGSDARRSLRRASNGPPPLLPVVRRDAPDGLCVPLPR